MSTLSNLRGKHPVYNRASPAEVPMWCPFCDSVIANSMSAESYKRRGCCRSCEDDIVERNMKKWNEGWRPSLEDISIVIAERSEIDTQRYYLHSRRIDGR